MAQEPFNHPLLTKVRPLRQAYFKVLAQGLSTAIDTNDPQLAELTEQVMYDCGLQLADAAKSMKMTAAELASNLEGKNKDAIAIVFAGSIIALLADQLPHPSEGL